MTLNKDLTGSMCKFYFVSFVISYVSSCMLLNLVHDVVSSIVESRTFRLFRK